MKIENYTECVPSYELRVRIQKAAGDRPASRAEVLALPEGGEGVGGVCGDDGTLFGGDGGALAVVLRLLVRVTLGDLGGERRAFAVSVEEFPVPLEVETRAEKETYVRVRMRREGCPSADSLSRICMHALLTHAVRRCTWGIPWRGRHIASF